MAHLSAFAFCRENEAFRVAADFFFENAVELAQFGEAGVAGAQGDAQRQVEADPEVDEADGDDGDESLHEGPKA